MLHLHLAKDRFCDFVRVAGVSISLCFSLLHFASSAYLELLCVHLLWSAVAYLICTIFQWHCFNFVQEIRCSKAIPVSLLLHEKEWPGPYIYTIYDRKYGNFPAKITV